jgi:aminobenzoyl-glutamate utilization protein A
MPAASQPADRAVPHIPRELEEQCVRWRREFHAFPELGFCEFWTAARICDALASLPGCKVRVGREVMDPDVRMGVPPAAQLEAARAAALARGANPEWVEKMAGGLTSVVADFDFGGTGPTVAFRCDIDALPVTESASESHRPVSQGFVSANSGRMHACGHDAHASLGLGLAHYIARNPEGRAGRLRVIFQGAEEGCCGASSMVAAGVVSDVDYFIAGHVGTAADETGIVSCGTAGWLATTKFDVELFGKPAHAGLSPEEGRNALLAAASLALQLHALPRHGGGNSRVKVGVLNAGSGRNIIADRATLKFEVRGETTGVNDYLAGEARRVVAAVAAMYDVRAEVSVVGAAQSATCDAPLKQIVRTVAGRLPSTRRVVDSLDTPGSEDATFFMRAVQQRGGQATYLLIGSALAAGHHHSAFDIDEAAIANGVQLYAALADHLLKPTSA